jgi:hypothetical protein
MPDWDRVGENTVPYILDSETDKPPRLNHPIFDKLFRTSLDMMLIAWDSDNVARSTRRRTALGFGRLGTFAGSMAEAWISGEAFQRSATILVHMPLTFG